LHVIRAPVEESGRVSGNESLHPCDISVISNKYPIAIFGNLRWFFISVDWKKVSGCKNIVSRSTKRAAGEVVRERHRKSISILADFVGSEESVVRHLLRHVIHGLAEKLKNFREKVAYGYDWRIDGTGSPG
jgi:hypothetical protein